MTHKFWWQLTAGTMLGLLLGSAARADVWQNTGGGSFNANGNWVDGSAPGTGDNVQFISNATYTVTFSSSPTNQNAFFTAAGGTVTLAIGAGNIWDLTAANYLNIGTTAGNNATVVLTSGSLVSEGYFLMGGASSTGTLQVNGGTFVTKMTAGVGTGARITINGNSSVWTNTGANLNVGNTAAGGQLVVTNGGRIVHAGSGGVVVGQNGAGSNNVLKVTGTNSLFESVQSLTVGSDFGNSNLLLIADGGMVRTLVAGTTASRVGQNGSNNVIWVTGSGSIWTNTGVFGIGNATAANSARDNQLIVTNGGRVVSTSTSASTIGAGNANVIGNVLRVAGTNSEFETLGALQVGVLGASNGVVITAGGTVRSATDSALGQATAGNYATVTGSGSKWIVGSGNYFYVGNTGAGNRLMITNGGLVQANTVVTRIGFGVGANGNVVTVTGSGSVFSNATELAVGDDGANNRLEILNGGLVHARSMNNFGLNSGANSNVVLVSGPGSELRFTGGGQNLKIGAAGSFNQLIVTNGGLVSWTNGSVSVGSGTGTNNELIVTGAGSRFDANGQNFGLNATNRIFITAGGEVRGNQFTLGGKESSILVTEGGVLEVNSQLNLNGASSTISNRGGVYQFTTSAPVFSLSGAGTSVAITNAVISYRGVTGANIANAQIAANITFQGTNTFRLNASTNAASGQSYTFNTGLGAANYTRLEMINGATRYEGGNVTIGTGGSMLISNTQATITGLFTNNGVFTSINSVGTFSSAVVNNGQWITDPTTNVFLANYTVASTGSIVMTSGDVFVFKSNFVNQSTQNGMYNTLAGKFLFNGTATTQTFATAGLDLGPGGIYPTLPGATNILSGNIPANNFGLGTLEISNASTVLVTDAFTLDNQRAALYLDLLNIGVNSMLIISNNVSVYYVGSNGWSFANNITLLGDAELHQLVPEPSTLLLVMTGAVVVWRKFRNPKSETRNKHE